MQSYNRFAQRQPNRQQGPALLRICMPVGPAPCAGSDFLEENDPSHLCEQSACNTTKRLRLNFAGHDMALADIPASVYARKAGDELVTVQPGRTHRQIVKEDSLIVELTLPSSKPALLRVARMLAARGVIGCRFGLVGASARWATSKVFSTRFTGVDSLSIGTDGGEEATVTVIG